MKTNFLLSGAVLFTLLALTCPWQAAAKASGHKKKLLLPTQAIDTGCEAFLRRTKITDMSNCVVSKSGTFGKVGSQTYQYEIYSDDEWIRGLSIFVRDKKSKKAKLLLDRYDEEGGILYYEKPIMAKHSFGTLLHVPIAVDGTGHYNESEYYLLSRNQKGWKLLDTAEWSDFPSPRGVWPDIKTMTVKAGIYHKGDGDCCPSEIAIMKLTVRNGKFVVKSMEIRKEESN